MSRPRLSRFGKSLGSSIFRLLHGINLDDDFVCVRARIWNRNQHQQALRCSLCGSTSHRTEACTAAGGRLSRKLKAENAELRQARESPECCRVWATNFQKTGELFQSLVGWTTGAMV